MTAILAIDPGSAQSAWLNYDGSRLGAFGITSNDVLAKALRSGGLPDVVVIEKIESYGMAVGAEVFAGETILTATNASAQFAYADGSTLSIYRGSAVVLSRTDAGPGLDLRRGAVDADIRKQPDGRHLRILGELMHAEIVGTEFRLMGDARTKSLGVRKGVVEVIRVADGQKVVLQAGNYAAVAPNWPYMRMDARVCPAWQAACRQAAGTPYP